MSECALENIYGGGSLGSLQCVETEQEFNFGKNRKG